MLPASFTVLYTLLAWFRLAVLPLYGRPATDEASVARSHSRAVIVELSATPDVSPLEPTFHGAVPAPSPLYEVRVGVTPSRLEPPLAVAAKGESLCRCRPRRGPSWWAWPLSVTTHGSKPWLPSSAL